MSKDFREGEQGDEGAETGDRRRARLADLQRLKTAMNKAEGEIAAMRELIEARDSKPIAKSTFYAQYFIASVLSTKGGSALAQRQRCEEAWGHYCSALANEPVPSIEDVWRMNHPAEVVQPTPPRRLTEPTPKGEPTPASLSAAFEVAVKAEAAKA